MRRDRQHQVPSPTPDMSKRHHGEDELEDAEPRGSGPEDVLEITPLGAGSEVGRSCILLRYKDKTVMLDCGIHPGLSGLASLPYLDDADLASVRERCRACRWLAARP